MGPSPDLLVHSEHGGSVYLLSGAFFKTHFSKYIESLKHPLHLLLLFLSEFLQQGLQMACLFNQEEENKMVQVGGLVMFL